MPFKAPGTLTAHRGYGLYREKKRDAKTVFRNIIRPKEVQALDDLVQRIAVHCERNHTWKNRTGALENSIRHSPVETTMDGFQAAVLAGGESKAQWSDRGVRAGEPVDVDYAVYVEAKGYPVLKQGVDKYRQRATQILGKGCRIAQV